MHLPPLSNLGRRYGIACLRIVVWAAVAFSAQAGSGLDPRKAITQLHHDSWGTQEGLPQHTVTSIVQTREGYLWLGTELGLVRFDGLRFTVFDQSNTPELGSSLIYALLEDREGRLWIGTSGGGLAYLSRGKFRSYTTANGLSNNVVLCLYEDRSGTVWIGTRGGGVSAFRNGRFQAYTTKDGLADDAVYAISEGRDGSLWMGTRKGLSRLAGGRFQVYTRADGQPPDYVRCLLHDRSGNLWIGTNGGGLSRFKDGRFTVFTTKDGLASNAVTSLFEDSAGSLWVGTIGGGLSRLVQNRFASYGNKDGLAGDDVWVLRQSRDGSLWIGSSGGLERLTNGAFTTWDTREGLSDDVVLPVFEDHTGNLWLGTQRGGLNRFRDGRFTAFTTRQGLAGNFVMTICEDWQGSLWIGTRDGLNRFRDGKFARYTTKDGLPANIVSATHVDRHGTLWVGTSAGLGKFENGRFTAYTTKDGMSNQAVHVIAEDHRGNLWIGTGGGGLNRLDNGHFTVFDSRQGLSNDVVLAIHADASGVLWVGTNGGGLNRIENGRVTTYTMKAGLLDDSILAILEDGLGNLWMSTEKGVFKASLRELNDFASGKTRSVATVSYGPVDGMKSQECNGAFQPAGWKTKDGRIWFPTMKGVVMVDPREAGFTQAAPPVVLEQAFIDRRTVDSQRPVRAPPGNGELEFRYAALGFDSPQKITFRYRLSGFDQEWTDAGTRRTAYYTNIPPGSYRFQVIARHGDGAWNSTGASFGFSLRPHFYQAHWFYALCVLSVFGLMIGWHLLHVRRLRIRDRILRQMEELNLGMRNEIAERERAERDLVQAKEAAERASRVKSEFLANMSHEIRTPMNAVLGMTELVLATGLTGEQRENLGVVRDSADALLGILNDILDFSKIEAGTLDLQAVDFDLPALVNETLRTLTGRVKEKGLKLVCQIEPGVPLNVRGDPLRLRQILLSLLGNAIKFTAQGEVTVEIECAEQDENGSKTHFIVRDTGVGIPRDKQEIIFSSFSQADSSTTRKFGGTGIGLAICSRLVSLMGGKIWVKSDSGSGSEFHFTVSFAAPEKTGKPALERPRTPSSLRILLAEDNIVNQRLVLRLLEKRGHSVAIAANGLEALAALEVDQFDVVLMDLQMPEMDGLEATAAIRKQERLAGGHLPIIAVTANTMNGERELCLAAGMDEYLSKPVQPASLFQAVENAVVPSGVELHGYGNVTTATP